jgi:hypothetical protein
MSIETIPAASTEKEIRLWTPALEVETQALAQLKNIARLPWVFQGSSTARGARLAQG